MPKKKTKRDPQPLADFTLADLIMAARAEADLTRAQLAAACGADYMTVARWEWGTHVPTDENLTAIANACNWTFIAGQPARIAPAANPGGDSATE